MSKQLLGLCLLLACMLAQPALAQRSTTLLAINDVYRISGIGDGALGGIPRLRSLRLQLEQQHPDLLVLHAGDLLFPSLLSRRYQGEQMIDMLNRLDGDAEAFDKRLFVTFGNHEFDKAKRKDAAMLQTRIRESGFHWLGSNLIFKLDEAGKPLVSADNLLAMKMVESGGIRIGLFSLTTNVKQPEYLQSFEDPLRTARLFTALLRRQGAEVVIALTHQRAFEDIDLLDALGDAGPDLIVGGHEHNRQTHRSKDGRLVIKADADAVTASVIQLQLDDTSGLQVEHRFARLDRSIAPDAQTAAVADAWQKRYEQETCQEQQDAPNCLSSAIGRTAMELVGEELEIRRYETNLGNFVADQALQAYREQGAQIAFVNSGSLRLNQDLPAGAAITERTLGELFAYPSRLALIRISGSMLQQVIEHAITDWTGNGRWLQIAGFAWQHDVPKAKAGNLTLLTPDGPRPVRPDEDIIAVVSDYLVNPAMDQDGYTMLNQGEILRPAEQGPNLVKLVRQAIKDAGEQGIAPTVEGRICSTDRTGPCLALKPEQQSPN